MELQDFLTRLEKVKKTPSGFQARCPAHDDNIASLSVSNGEKGIVLHCHANCPPDRVVEKLGLEMTDLFKEEPKRNGNGKFHIKAEYNYRDEQGNLLYQAVRLEPKDFRQRRPDGNGWSWSLQGVPRVLYRLPELLAADPDDYVFIVEGEKDVENLRVLGLVATCNVGGAGKWRNEYSLWLENRICIIIGDNDDAGRLHAQQVYNSISQANVGAVARILNLPDLPQKGDVSDWLLAGGDADQLRALAEKALTAQDDETVEVVAVAAPFWRRTHEGLAREFVNRYGQDFRYVNNLKTDLKADNFAFWSGKKWEFRAPAAVMVADYMRRMTAEMREVVSQSAEELDKTLAKFSKELESAGFKSGWKQEIKSFREIQVTFDQFDRDGWLLNTASGTIDLKSGKKHKHRRADLITKLTQTEYRERAQCPTWLQFLNDIFEGNQELIAFIKRAVGYSLTGQSTEQCLFILYGHGANGKSVFLNTIRFVLGDYAGTALVKSFIQKQNDSSQANNDLAMLAGKRFVAAIETNKGQRIDEALIKAVTHGDPIQARFLYSEFFEFKPTFKLWFGVNHKPDIPGTDLGIWRSIRLVPFNRTFAPQEQDKTLETRLMAEAEGILLWAIEGCLEWQESGLNPPDVVLAAVEDYRQEQDLLGQYIKDRCIEGKAYQVKASELYKDYLSWAEENGHRYPLSMTSFGRDLSNRGYAPDKIGGVGYRKGIALLHEDEN